MKNILLSVLFIGTLLAQSKQIKQFQLDKESIKALAGMYKVTFQFAETFSPDPFYTYHDRKIESALEYVFILEESDRFISLQHLLIINDSTIIKHWRQDWLYENQDIFEFYKDNEWSKKTLKKETVLGTWTQKVYHVDDSPRYENIGTWVHINGKHYFESDADSPLPRREYTKRSDYNVLKRHSRIEILDNAWVLNQDNKKILRRDGEDKLICEEKGLEIFTKGLYNSQAAINWWNKNQTYWQNINVEWKKFYANNNSIKFKIKNDEKMMYEAFSEYGKLYLNKSDADLQKGFKNIVESFNKK